MARMSNKLLGVVLLLFFPLTGCENNSMQRQEILAIDNPYPKPSPTPVLTVDEYELQRSNDIDPFEPVNRVFFHFNTIVDGVLINPLASLYADAVPTPAQTGVRNVLHNLWSPISMVNSLLQGKVEDALESCTRFIINSTLGILGIFDVASDMGLEKHDEDFGQTLAVWGMVDGPYIVLPIIGPSNLRDVLGRTVDYFMDPFNYYARVKWGRKYIYLRFVATILSSRAAHLQDIKTLRETSLDFYATVRSLYGQYRQDKIMDGVVLIEEEGPEAFMDDEDFFATGGEAVSSQQN